MRWARRTGRRERAKLAEERRPFSERGGRPSLEGVLERDCPWVEGGLGEGRGLRRGGVLD